MFRNLPQEKIVDICATNPSSLSPASRRGRRITRFTRLLPAVSLILLAVTTSAFAQEAQTAHVPVPKPAVSSDWERMMEGLKKAKPMPDPKHGVRPDVLTPSGDLRRYDALTGESVEVPSAKVADASPRIHQERGRPGAAPTSANGGPSTMPVMSPADILRALSS